MRRLRASAGRAARPRTYTAHARRNIRAAAEFLAWLHGRGRALAACRQADVESWLTTGPAACQVRDFLSWAARHGHCPAFDIPGPARASGTAASQDERWALAARLLHDDTLDLTDRAAGCLLLLYGQQLSRIAAMTTSQVTTRDGTVHIRLGDHDVPVPEPLGIVLTELVRTGRSHTGTGSPAITPWLFPGGLPGKPITAPGSAAACAPSAPTPRPDGGPRSLTSPASCPPPSSPTSSASPPAPQSDGCAKPEVTGPATQPN